MARRKSSLISIFVFISCAEIVHKIDLKTHIYIPTPGEIEELKKSGLEEVDSEDMEGDEEMGEKTDITNLYGFDKYDDEDDTTGGTFIFILFVLPSYSS
jgi:hypothetical protein